MKNILAQRVTGESITNGAAINGQVIYVAVEPLLVAGLSGTNRVIEFYGRPGIAYELLTAKQP